MSTAKVAEWVKERIRPKTGEADTGTRQFLLLLWRHLAVPYPAAAGLRCVYAVLLYPGTRKCAVEHCASEQ